MPAIKAILFDLDDTLIDDDSSYALSMQRLCDDFAPKFDIARLRQAYDALSPMWWGSGDLASEREVLWRRALQDAAYDPSLAATVRDRYLHHRVETSAPLDGIEAVLRSLSGIYRLAVVTNGGGDIQPARLRYAGLDGYFDLIVTSSDTDAGKPDPAIFQHALERLGVRADEALMVGDSLSAEIAGALASGMTAVWLNRTGRTRDGTHPEPHHEIASLSELPGLLGI
jgi:putative hydrolase of the HAD superfamily